MLVFIDESGDPGFRVDAGATPVFVLAMVMFPDDAAAAATMRAIAEFRQRHRFRSELKFNKTNDDLRDAFFASVAAQPFQLRGLVVQKERIHSLHLQTDKGRFYNFFLGKMLRFDNGRLQDAKIVIDGSGDRDFKREMRAYLDRHVRDGAIRKVGFKDSKNDDLVQLADMCAGAIARSYRRDRDRAGRWRDMLRRRIDDIWDFR